MWWRDVHACTDGHFGEESFGTSPWSRLPVASGKERRQVTVQVSGLSADNEKAGSLERTQTLPDQASPVVAEFMDDGKEALR